MPTLPLVVSKRSGNSRTIAALDRRAEGLGLRRGASIAEARAMHPGLDVVEAEPEADMRLLEAIADWCGRYTPLVSIAGEAGENCLFLDITGCAHLFGGEKALLDDAVARLAIQGFAVEAGLASTPGAAWATSRYASGTIVATGEEKDLLAPLPLAALRVGAATCAALASVGLRVVGAILRAPRAPIVRRFGREVVLRLDQALGHVDEPISPRLPVPVLAVERHFAEPVLLMEDIIEIASLLAQRMKGDFERRGEGARRLRLLLFRVDGAVIAVEVATSLPMQDAERIGRLFRERLAAMEGSMDAGYGFDLIRLAAIETERVAEEQDGIGDERDCSADIALFADRIAMRLGAGAVSRPVLIQSHIPERAVRESAFSAGQSPMPAASQSARRRPVRLLDPPEQIDITAVELPEGPPARFRWRRASYRVTASEGPERIEPEWWHTDPATDDMRDYFQVQDEAGRRYWIYRRGLYGAATGPRWFMHGLFA